MFVYQELKKSFGTTVIIFNLQESEWQEEMKRNFKKKAGGADQSTD